MSEPSTLESHHRHRSLRLSLCSMPTLQLRPGNEAQAVILRKGRTPRELGIPGFSDCEAIARYTEILQHSLETARPRARDNGKTSSTY